jgi:hypothetical protein
VVVTVLVDPKGDVMLTRTTRKSSLALGCIAALLLGSGQALAQSHSGGGGGHAMARGGYGYGGYHGGYGYGGYRGGYGWRGGYYGGWGWGLGLGLGAGLYFATLPLYYSTLWWDGIPYYYADNTYYRYDGGVRQYVTVAPPPGVQAQVASSEPVGTELIAYPKNGQSTEQQATDKYECHHWATTQSGFDPTQGATAAASAGKRADYMRAQTACLDGRGYSVR